MKRFIFFATLAVISCSRDGKTSTGTIVTATDGSRTRIEVVSDRIIRVSAVPKGADFSDKKSLAVIAGADHPAFSYEDNGENVVIGTESLRVRVSRESGNVIFTDADGRTYTYESGRQFTPIEVEGTKAWTVRQTFADQDDEAFYGLGQHQAGEWNYKNKNEELYQYNTKISVPFIVSTKGYGILWDSYSLCRWGDPRDYAAIGDVFDLYDCNGEKGAIDGTYTAADGTVLRRRESSLNQEYLIEPEMARVEGSPEGFKFNGSSVVFEGDLVPKENGQYRFLLYYAGYMKLYLDGELVVPEIWRTAWNPNSHKFSASLEKGVKTHIKIEWKPDGDVSYCGLRALSPRKDDTGWWGEMQDQIDYYFIAGGTETLDGVISGYRTLTGKAPIMPKWAMGFWQCRERYVSQDNILSTFKELRDMHIPVDNIVQDWQYWKSDQWGSHEFDPERFPDPKAMVDSIHSMGGRYMISVWPKFYEGTQHFKEMDERGWMYRTAIEDNVIDWLGYRQSFYDAYAPGARRLFWQQMKDHLWGLGVDAWWMDASEPNIRDCTDMDYRKKLCGPTYLGPSTQYFNAYGLMNAQAIYEGQRATDPSKRVFLLTRSGFLGLQRYSTACWSGDIGTRWEDMRTQLAAGLNFAMSGIPFWTEDIGGFSVENRYIAAQKVWDETGVENEDMKEWRELNVRWHQMGMFNPLYRVHGQYPFREIWNIAPEFSATYETIRICDKMRYYLMPYIYTLDADTYFKDFTIMRPLVMDFPQDLRAREISDELLFGRALLVCPVMEYGARSREVYLPDGTWYDLMDSYKSYEGGRSYTFKAPYDHIPVLARAGEMVPTGPEIEYTAQKQNGSLTIHVFTGKDAFFDLYEDDGVSYDYENGAFSRILFTWDEASRKFTIGERRGSFDGMFGKRLVIVDLVSKDGKVSKRVEYDGSAVTLQF